MLRSLASVLIVVKRGLECTFQVWIEADSDGSRLGYCERVSRRELIADEIVRLVVRPALIIPGCRQGEWMSTGHARSRPMRQRTCVELKTVRHREAPMMLMTVLFERLWDMLMMRRRKELAASTLTGRRSKLLNQRAAR